MKRPRTHPLGLSVGRRSQEHARSIITEAASRDWGGPIIAALHLVFVSLLRSRPRSTGRRSYGGPAIMIMHRVNLGVGVPGMEAMGGPPGITETEAKRLGSPYCSGRSRRIGARSRTRGQPAVKREAEKDCRQSRRFSRSSSPGTG